LNRTLCKRREEKKRRVAHLSWAKVGAKRGKQSKETSVGNGTCDQKKGI